MDTPPALYSQRRDARRARDLRAAAAELLQRAAIHEAEIESDTSRELRERLEGEVVGHALADVRAEILDAHGAVAVHDLETDPRRHVGDVAGKVVPIAPWTSRKSGSLAVLVRQRLHAPQRSAAGRCV